MYGEDMNDADRVGPNMIDDGAKHEGKLDDIAVMGR